MTSPDIETFESALSQFSNYMQSAHFDVSLSISDAGMPIIEAFPTGEDDFYPEFTFYTTYIEEDDGYAFDATIQYPTIFTEDLSYADSLIYISKLWIEIGKAIDKLKRVEYIPSNYIDE